DVVAAEDMPILLAERDKLGAGAPSSGYEARARRKDGMVIELGVTGSLYDLEGQQATVGMAQDITEKKRAEEQIEQYVAQLETAFMSTVNVATTLGEMRDPYTAGHQRRVAEIAVAIGAELGFDAHRQEGLRVAGYLHDIGKITIPAEILSKPGKLSALEYTLIQGHAQASYDVLKDMRLPWSVAEVALQHHERIDGSGYPQGLKGEAILLEARIIGVADVIEAMSSHRPYRPGLGMDSALAEIERGRGSIYDATVIDACLRLFREKGYTIPT
ncbi:MAG: HD domain-containing protein, partial [Betaproteobacteria bacterium]|nr:HD domain-containing protein [Betaproteobacteria bacterium]